MAPVEHLQAITIQLWLIFFSSKHTKVVRTTCVATEVDDT